MPRNDSLDAIRLLSSTSANASSSEYAGQHAQRSSDRAILRTREHLEEVLRRSLAGADLGCDTPSACYCIEDLLGLFDRTGTSPMPKDATVSGRVEDIEVSASPRWRRKD